MAAQLYNFEVRIDWGYPVIIRAETASKARYRYFKNELAESHEYKEVFKFMQSKNLGKVDVNKQEPLTGFKLTQFNDVISKRGIKFATVGMKITVAGKEGRIISANNHCNLDIDFGDAHPANCHPNWETVYYDDNNNIIKSFELTK